MAKDLLLGKTRRSWCRDVVGGKSSAELWDEAESQRLRRPVKYMSDEANPAGPPSPTPEHGVSFAKTVVPAAVGSLVAGIVLFPILRNYKR